MFISATHNSILDASDVHIWCAGLDNFAGDAAAIAEFWRILSVQERERALRFVQKQHQTQFIISHGILRTLISSYLQIDAASVAFSQNAYGKLEIAKSVINLNSSLNLQFNLSHAENLAVFAFTLNNPIGIDIEFVKEKIDFIDIARRFFAVREVEAILQMPDEVTQKAAFFNCWTRKEAFIKAIGRGLSFPLNKFSVDVCDIAFGGNANIAIEDPSYNSELWKLVAFQPSPNYVGALAMKHKESLVKYFNFE